MIYNPTPSSTPPADAAADLSAANRRGNFIAAQSEQAENLREIDLNSQGGWSELIRDIVAIASSGGGRLEVRCIPANDSASSTGRVFSAPIDSTSNAKPTASVTGTKSIASANLQPVRIVTDPDAPALQPQDVDRLYPWRQKDLLRELNSRLGRRVLNSYDIQAIRRQHQLDDRPDFVFNLPGAGRRYSPAAANWIMDEYARDPEFFHRARMADHEIMKLRRQKPK
jgi:hypothetical protein